MKIFFALTFFLIPFLSMSQSADELKEIEFRTETRGAWKSLRITPDSLHYQQWLRGDSQEFERAITKEEWQQLQQALQGIDLNKLDQLPAPGEKRASDRAYHSRFIIRTAQNTYQSQHFDDRNPHKSLMPLMQVVSRLLEDIQLQERQ